MTIITARPPANSPAAIELADFRSSLKSKSDEELQKMLQDKGLTDSQRQAIKDEIAARSARSGGTMAERPSGKVEAGRPAAATGDHI